MQSLAYVGELWVKTPLGFLLRPRDPKTYRHTHTYTVLHYLDLFYIDCITLVLDVCLNFSTIVDKSKLSTLSTVMHHYGDI